MDSRCEYKQSLMRKEFHDDQRLRWFVGDVRDEKRLARAMRDMDLVVHAAALKRVEVGEYNPDEMVKTNVGGALNVIDAAIDANVNKVVALSTDKACAPVNAYGASKLMAEKLFLAANNISGQRGPRFSVTRYGNVAGSTGSVIPLWRKMIADGIDIVPVTDPDCTRFWMSLDEAVDLVIDTAETMRGGELSIPQLPAYRLGDLAEAMNVGMRITGLGSHEKLHESMAEGNTSDLARRLSVDEIREKLRYV
jgi:UDP-N-acetylglucosamine 4,6-dehydratase